MGAPTLMGMRTMLNAWGRIASPKREALRRHYADVATDVIVNLNDGNASSEWHTFFDATDTVEAIAHLRELGAEVHVMTWTRTNHEWLFPMVDWLLELVEGANIASVLFDLEGPWAKGRQSKREDAADVIATEFRDIAWGITDVPMRKWSTIAPIAECADYWMPQCHTFGHRKGLPHNRWKRPGVLERWTHKRWGARLSEGQRLIPHLADYHVGSYRQTEAGLRESIETCRDLGYEEVAAWTGIAGPKHPDVWRALKGAA